MRNLGALEAEVMKCLWVSGEPLSVRQVVDRLAEDTPRAYTTVMTVLENLHRKGLVDREKHGRAFSYSPTVTREQHTAELMGGVLSGSHDRGATLLHFVGQMTPDEVAQLQAALQRLNESRGSR